MKSVFLSDAHLRSPRDRGYRDMMGFLDFLAAAEIDQLFIAGDFFDFWFGRRDRICPDFAPVVEKLADLAGAGVRIGLCEGNHDFFLGDHFAGIPGFEVYPDSALIDLDGQKTLVAHGDLVDRENRGYLMLRRVLRSRPFYRLQRSLPPPLLWRLARISSHTSRELYPQREEQLVRKMLDFAMEKFSEGLDHVILGHSHRPLLKEFDGAGGRKTFASLGDWMRYNSYLRHEGGKFSLLYYKSQ